MPKFSRVFQLHKSQAELDFVDVALDTDSRLFVDPFSISQRQDRWSQSAHQTLITFFQTVVDEIRAGNHERALALLRHLHEPNETRLGYSRRRPQGSGIGNEQAVEFFEALRDSAAVQTGFLTSLEESELMVDGVSFDRISDLTTNVIRSHLAVC